MKRIILLIVILRPLFCLSQTEKGSFFIETGTTLFGNGGNQSYIGKTGLLLWRSKTHYDRNYQFANDDRNNGITYFLYPRLGYYLSNKLTAGIDFQFSNNHYKVVNYGFADKYNHFTTGIFLQYYFVQKKHTPFAEFAAGTGHSKYIQRTIAPSGGRYNIYTYKNLPYISGTAGYLFSLNSRFKLGIAATVKNTFEKPSNKGTVVDHIRNISILETGLVASASYRFRISKKENAK